MAEPQTTDIPCATAMFGNLEFVSQSDGSVLIVSGEQRFHRVEFAAADQLHVWLNNHLVWCTEHGI